MAIIDEGGWVKFTIIVSVMVIFYCYVYEGMGNEGEEEEDDLPMDDEK